jgi:hypothetical protein
MTAGRPTEYDAEMLAKAQDYIEHSTTYEDIVPSVAGLSLVLGVARSTLYKWAEAYPEFSDTLEDLKAKQERELVHNGLTSIFNPTITKLMLANHGYSEKTETDITSKGDKITVQPIMYENSTTAPVQTEVVSAPTTESA